VVKRSKVCLSCGREFAWRKKWEDSWDEVRYCSRKCRREKDGDHEGRELEAAILELLQRRSARATICPSEVARERYDEAAWRSKMEDVRRAARRLVARGRIEILQRGHVVDPSTFKGPVRLRAKTGRHGGWSQLPE
jgi:hypothetical protein